MDEGAPKKRQICGQCERPASVCLCPALPTSKFILHGKVIILQHPHEQKRTLSTIKLFSKCIECTIIQRRNIPKSGPIFDTITTTVQEAVTNNIPMYLLFPGDEAVDLETTHKQSKQQSTDQKAEPEGQQEPKPQYILIAIDGTWPQAKEMYAAMSPLFIPPGIQVKLVSSAEDEASNIYKLRTEPVAGLMTTHECLAKAIGILEHNDTLTSNLLKPLQLMVELQAKNNPSLQQRLGPDGFYVKGTNRKQLGNGDLQKEDVEMIGTDNDTTKKRNRTENVDGDQQKRPKIDQTD